MAEQSRMRRGGGIFVNVELILIGNLTLVDGSDNASLQNKSFIEKQKIYEKQSCRLTSSLAKKSKLVQLKHDLIGLFRHLIIRQYLQNGMKKR